MAKIIRQRRRLYAAENDVWPEYGTPTPEAAQAWYDWIAKTAWWRQHSDVHHMRVRYPVLGTMSGIVMDGDVAVVSFGPFSLTKPCLTHELGHVLDYHPGTDADAMEKDHDPKFAGILLALVKRYMSAEEADRLAKQFEQRNVKWIPYE